MRWLVYAFFVAGSALSVACGTEDGEPSDITNVNQSPNTAAQEGGAGQSALDASSAGDGGTSSVFADASAADSGRLTDAGGALAVEAGARNDAGRDASAGDGATADGAAASSDSPCPSDGGPCVILPLGDSITYGLGTSDNSSYRVELFRKALAAKQHITFVGSQQSGPAMVDGMTFPRNNEGHSGWTISQVADLIPSPALTSKPNIVLLMAGTNDMYVSPGPADAPTRLKALLNKLIEADPQMFIVVAQLTPATSFMEPVKTFNAALPAIVQALAMAGKHVTLVDLNTGFPMGALADGVHPSSEGYKWMAGVWYDAIKQWLR